MQRSNNIRMGRDCQSSMAAAEYAIGNRGCAPHKLARFQFWRGQGPSVRTVTPVAATHCRSGEEIRDPGRRFFGQQKNCGTQTREKLSEPPGGYSDASRQRDLSLQRAPDHVLIEELGCRDIDTRR